MAKHNFIFGVSKAKFDINNMTLTEEKKDSIQVFDLLKVLQDLDEEIITLTITKEDSADKYLKQG